MKGPNSSTRCSAIAGSSVSWKVLRLEAWALARGLDSRGLGWFVWSTSADISLGISITSRTAELWDLTSWVQSPVTCDSSIGLTDFKLPFNDFNGRFCEAKIWESWDCCVLRSVSPTGKEAKSLSSASNSLTTLITSPLVSVNNALITSLSISGKQVFKNSTPVEKSFAAYPEEGSSPSWRRLCTSLNISSVGWCLFSWVTLSPHTRSGP